MRACAARPSVFAESGHALVLALIVLLLTATSMTLLSRTLLMELRETRAAEARLHLVALADAVLAESLAHLAQQPGFRGVQRRQVGAGQVESQIAPDGPARPSGQPLRIGVTSRVGGRSYRVEARVRVRPGESPELLSWRRLTSD